MRHRRSLILDTVLDGLFRVALLFSVFLLFEGHNAPGGGFVGGLVAVGALVLRYVADGVPEVDRVVPVSAPAVLGTGLAIAMATALGGFVWADDFLASAKIETEVPLLGTLKATTALPFDIGVYLIVVGLGLVVVRALGAETVDREAA